MLGTSCGRVRRLTHVGAGALDTAVDAARALREARRRAGLTQAELARRAGVRPQVVNRIERALVDPRMGTLARLLACAHADLDVVPRSESWVDREGIRELLSRDARFRIDPTHLGALDELCQRRVRFVVLGDVAARLHGAPVGVSSVEVALQDDERNRWHFQRAARLGRGSLACLEVRAPVLYDRFRGGASPLPWLRPSRRMFNEWQDAPTGFLPELRSLAAADPARRDLLAAVQQEVDVLSPGFRINYQRMDW
jgi:transcriptional regulator with XRE-family HTH domain